MKTTSRLIKAIMTGGGLERCEAEDQLDLAFEEIRHNEAEGSETDYDEILKEAYLELDYAEEFLAAYQEWCETHPLPTRITCDLCLEPIWSDQVWEVDVGKACHLCWLSTKRK